MAHEQLLLLYPCSLCSQLESYLLYFGYWWVLSLFLVCHLFNFRTSCVYVIYFLIRKRAYIIFHFKSRATPPWYRREKFSLYMIDFAYIATKL